MGITFNEIGDDCSLCPFQAKGCSGLVNNGNGPVYPPCSELDPEMDLDVYMEQMEEQKRKNRAFLREQAARKIEEQKKKELRRKRRQYSDQQCQKEIKKVNELKKLKTKLEKAIASTELDLQFMETMASIGVSIGNVETAKDGVAAAKELLDKTVISLDNAKQQLAVKRMKIMKSEEYQSIK